MTMHKTVTPNGTRKVVTLEGAPVAKAAPVATKCANCTHRDDIEPCDERFNVTYAAGNGFVVLACTGFEPVKTAEGAG